jgi:hypothetical protein
MSNFVTDVLALIAEHDEHSALYWRVQDGAVTFSVNCSDVFFWGCADAEDVTPENLPLLRLALEQGGGTDLFVARVRGMRPQGAVYKYIDQAEWPLFDACGPERPAEFGNPYDREMVLKWLAEKAKSK